MSADTKKTIREFKVTVIVEEVVAPKLANIQMPDTWAEDADEFLDEGDYSPASPGGGT